MEANKTFLNILEYIKVTNYTIDMLMFEKIWFCINYSQVIYIDDELLKWFGIPDTDRKYIFMKDYLINFQERFNYHHYNNIKYKKFLYLMNTIDYSELMGCSKVFPEINSDQLLDNNKSQHLLVSSNTFKIILNNSKLPQHKSIQIYYQNFQKLIQEYDNYLQMENDQNPKYKNIQINLKPSEKKEYIYIATSVNHSLLNEYKMGGTTDLNIELINLNKNVSKSPKDILYYASIYGCYNSQMIQDKLKNIFTAYYLKTNNFYKINYFTFQKVMEEFCDFYNEESDVINHFILSDYRKSFGLPNFIPKPIPVLEYLDSSGLFNFEEMLKKQHKPQNSVITISKMFKDLKLN